MQVVLHSVCVYLTAISLRRASGDVPCHREMYTESITPSMTKLYISETHNKHAGPYTCALLDVIHGHLVVHRTVTLLLYSKTVSSSYTDFSSVVSNER